MVEDSLGDAELPVHQGPDFEEVRHHRVDGGGFPEGPGHLNTMADDASRKFDLDLTNFLSTFSSTYSSLQSPGSWHTCHLPSKIVSLVIFALRKHSFEADTSPVKKLPASTETG